MAIETQGVKLRRQSTTAGSTASSSGTMLYFSSVSIFRSDAGSFITDGFSTGMRVETDSTVNSTRVMTLLSVAATIIGVSGVISTQSSGANIVVTGRTMEEIGAVTGFNGPAGTMPVIDITSLKSTAKEKQIGSVRDEGQITFDVLYDTNATALHTALREDMTAKTERIYDITLTDQSTNATSLPSAAYFTGFVSGFSIAGAGEDVIKPSLTLEVTSSVRWINKVV